MVPGAPERPSKKPRRQKQGSAVREQAGKTIRTMVDTWWSVDTTDEQIQAYVTSDSYRTSLLDQLEPGHHPAMVSPSCSFSCFMLLLFSCSCGP